MRFWDSSAIVPLLVGQAGSALADVWLGRDREVVLWTLTPVEVVSALRRLVREGALDGSAALMAEERTDELLAASHVIVDIESAKVRARRLLRLHALRAADSLQLAAALEWAGGQPHRHVLHTLDDRLADAARLEGFRVNPKD